MGVSCDQGSMGAGYSSQAARKRLPIGRLCPQNRPKQGCEGTGRAACTGTSSTAIRISPWPSSRTRGGTSPALRAPGTPSPSPTPSPGGLVLILGTIFATERVLGERHAGPVRRAADGALRPAPGPARRRPLPGGEPRRPGPLPAGRPHRPAAPHGGGGPDPLAARPQALGAPGRARRRPGLEHRQPLLRRLGRRPHPHGRRTAADRRDARAAGDSRRQPPEARGLRRRARLRRRPRRGEPQQRTRGPSPSAQPDRRPDPCGRRARRARGHRALQPLPRGGPR